MGPSIGYYPLEYPWRYVGESPHPPLLSVRLAYRTFCCPAFRNLAVSYVMICHCHQVPHVCPAVRKDQSSTLLSVSRVPSMSLWCPPALCPHGSAPICLPLSLPQAFSTRPLLHQVLCTVYLGTYLDMGQPKSPPHSLHYIL